jgi:hypothetical protein
VNGFLCFNRIVDEVGNDPKETEESFMKKWWIGIFTAAMVLAVSATSVFADASVKGQSTAQPNGGSVSGVAVVMTEKSTADSQVLSETAAATMRWANENRQNYVDADGDGVCDNRGTGNCGNGNGQNGQNYVDADGDGVCDNRGTGNCGNGNGQNGQNYVDADGDGVCDNYGTGNGNGGNGQNYVDADSDGVCDNYANRPQDGTGNKHGGCRGRGC